MQSLTTGAPGPRDRKPRGIRSLRKSLIGAFAVALGLLALAPASSFAAGNDVNTTVAQEGGACQNGSGEPNCNIYLDKSDVYLSGAQVLNGKGLKNGDYFFAVLDPGGQADPTDGSPKNLSSPFDSYGDRKFNVTDGLITNEGTHANGTGLNGEPVIQAMPYGDTSNPGGVYILAVCQWLGDGNANDATDPSTCKYDAFKIKSAQGEPPTPPVVTKDATATFKRTFPWSVSKSVDKTLFKQIGGSVTANYTITATKGAGVDSDWAVKGTIAVTNFNDDPVTLDDVSDDIGDPNASCTVDKSATLVVPANSENDYPYTCLYSAAPDPTNTVNTATATWSDQDVGGQTLPGNDGTGTASFAFGTDPTADNPKVIDDCTTVTDTLDDVTTTLGHTCATTTYKPSATFNVPTNGCVDHGNTATETTDDLGLADSDSASVRVCGPAKTGALTMGFWKGPNGNGLIQGYCAPSGGTSLATYLSGLGAGNGPFSDAAGKSCSQLVTYVNNILNKASATDMNKMLKAQMLATALDVYFSGPGWTSTKSGGVKPPSNFLSHNSLGTFNMDTTAVCPMVDNLSTGSATCKNTTPSSDAVAAGAVPTSPMSMQAILDFAATTPSPFDGTSIWYAGNRTREELLKNIYDQFNNQLAFGSF
jgi:hypothetical protein